VIPLSTRRRAHIVLQGAKGVYRLSHLDEPTDYHRSEVQAVEEWEWNPEIEDPLRIALTLTFVYAKNKAGHDALAALTADATEFMARSKICCSLVC
jgi:hypothetical protein